MLIIIQFVLCIIVYCHFTSDENFSYVIVRNFQTNLKISQLLKWALHCNRVGIYAWKVLTSADGCVCHGLLWVTHVVSAACTHILIAIQQVVAPVVDDKPPLQLSMPQPHCQYHLWL